MMFAPDIWAGGGRGKGGACFMFATCGARPKGFQFLIFLLLLLLLLLLLFSFFIFTIAIFLGQYCKFPAFSGRVIFRIAFSAKRYDV